MTTKQYSRVYESSYPYSKGYYHNDKGKSLINRLFNILPHGSGIDYTWHITQHIAKPNRFTCSNAYHAMDEYGGYCHSYDFRVTIDYNPDTDSFVFVRFSFCGQRENNCCGFGLVDYLVDTLIYSIQG